MAREPRTFPIIRLSKRVGRAQRLTGSSNPPPPGFSHTAQVGRLTGHFDKLRSDLASFTLEGTVSDDSLAIVPGRALVLKILGSLPNFAAAARAVGLEFLGEDLADLAEDERPVVPKEQRQPADIGHLYLSMADERALRKLLSFWDTWRRTSEVPEEGSQWKAIFPLIATLRSWSVADRIEEQTIAFILRRIADSPRSPVTLEVDLWFRDGKTVRDRRRNTFFEHLLEADGTLLDEVVIEKIHYHGVLVSLPPTAALDIVQRVGSIAGSDEVMSVRPQSLAAFDLNDGTDDDQATIRTLGDVDDRPPLIGILDGFPIANHAYLRGRIDVHVVDVEEGDVPVARRFHGTQMASLVLHGDLHDERQITLPRRVACIPVLGIGPDGRETTPHNKLPIGLIQRAVTSMVVGLEEDDEPLAPSLIVFNHSIVDENRPYGRLPSAWARLLDHLMFEHNVLFVTSAGNVRSEFTVEGYPDVRSFRSAEATARAVAILRGLHSARESRRMMSPAESVNGLTVGALHDDLTEASYPHDPFELGGSAAVYSAIGPGVAGSVKPDFLAPGGRELVAPRLDGTDLRVRGLANPNLGHLAAAPDLSGLTDNARRRCSGTSNAAALTTRMVGLLAETLDELVEHEPEEEEWFDRSTRAVVLKALVAHGARWGVPGQALEALRDPLGRHALRRRKHAAGLIGYGPCDVGRVLTGSGRRVTMLAEGTISHHERHEFDIPLPAGMHGIREVRDIDLTLAWMSPLRPRASNHRAVGLVLTGGERSETVFWSGATTAGIAQPPPKMTAKGTLRRLHLKGDRVMSLAAGETMRVGVQATASPGFSDVKVPYALVATIEVGALVTEDIHSQVNEALRLQARERAAARARVRTRTRQTR